MTRATLPQNYEKSAGTILESFESLTGFTKTGTGTMELDAVNHKYGTAGIKITTSAAFPGLRINKTLNPSVNLQQGAKLIHIWAHFHDANCDGLTITLISGANTFEKAVNGANGWKHFTIARSEWNNSGADSWANARTSVQVRVVAKAGTTAAVTIDVIYYDAETLPRCVISFDDAYSSVYDVAYPIMAAAGIVGTVYVVQSTVGTTGIMTLAQLKTLYDAGWCIANHTYDHPTTTNDNSKYPNKGLDELTYVQQLDEIGTCDVWLTANGFATGKHLAFPGGRYNATTLQVMDAIGIKTGRKTIGGVQYMPAEDIRALNCAVEFGSPGGTYTTLATAKGLVDTAAARGGAIFTYGHKIAEAVGSDELTWTTADFTALIKYIVAKKIVCLNQDEWYNGLTNPRKKIV